MKEGMRLAAPWLAQRWGRLTGYLATPGVRAAEEPRFRFGQLLGVNTALAASTTLAPRTAMYVARRFYFVDAVIETVDGDRKSVV